MKFKTHLAMESYPELDVDARLDPVTFQAGLHGSCDMTVDAITLQVSEIPIRLAIPFLKRRRRRLPLLASIGGFKVDLSPIHFKSEGLNLQLDGALGTKGLSGHLHGKVNCKTEMQADGGVTGKLGTVTLCLGEEEEGEERAS